MKIYEIGFAISFSTKISSLSLVSVRETRTQNRSKRRSLISSILNERSTTERRGNRPRKCVEEKENSFSSEGDDDKLVQFVQWKTRQEGREISQERRGESLQNSVCRTGCIPFSWKRGRDLRFLSASEGHGMKYDFSLLFMLSRSLGSCSCSFLRLFMISSSCDPFSSLFFDRFDRSPIFLLHILLFPLLHRWMLFKHHSIIDSLPHPT